MIMNAILQSTSSIKFITPRARAAGHIYGCFWTTHNFLFFYEPPTQYISLKMPWNHQKCHLTGVNFLPYHYSQSPLHMYWPEVAQKWWEQCRKSKCAYTSAVVLHRIEMSRNVQLTNHNKSQLLNIINKHHVPWLTKTAHPEVCASIMATTFVVHSWCFFLI